MKVISYLSGIPKVNNSPQKAAILHNYIQGVNRTPGDQGIVHTGFDPQDCDVAVIQGFSHEHGKRAPHLQLRSNVVEHQKRTGGRTLIADSNLFLYVDKSNPHNYLRYSYDGVFKNTGFYFDKEIDPMRWKKISTDLGINLKDYRTNGEHILMPLQRNGGWSMRGQDVMEWCRNTITEIRKFTDRPIVVRGHPGDKKAQFYLKLQMKNVIVSPLKRDIKDDLKNAWATVCFNSSPGVASLIEGVPVFLMDPDPNFSQYSDVANTKLKRIEDPKMPDRQEWIERISMCHWKFDELVTGEAWQFMRLYR